MILVLSRALGHRIGVSVHVRFIFLLLKEREQVVME